jgi:hypothetical protein
MLIWCSDSAVPSHSAKELLLALMLASPVECISIT